jgi:hypothetical protein
MKVTLEAVLEGKNTLAVSAEVEVFADLTKLAKKLQDHVAGVKKLMPDMAASKVEKLRISME